MKNSEFDFGNFLTNNGYEKEVILGAEGMVYCTLFQKEVKEHKHNAVSILPIGVFSASSPDNYIRYSGVKVPSSETEAKRIIKNIEIVTRDDE